MGLDHCVRLVAGERLARDRSAIRRPCPPCQAWCGLVSVGYGSGMMWYGVVWCSLVWSVWHGVVWCGQCDVICEVWYGARGMISEV